MKNSFLGGQLFLASDVERTWVKSFALQTQFVSLPLPLQCHLGLVAVQYQKEMVVGLAAIKFVRSTNISP